MKKLLLSIKNHHLFGIFLLSITFVLLDMPSAQGQVNDPGSHVAYEARNIGDPRAKQTLRFSEWSIYRRSILEFEYGAYGWAKCTAGENQYLIEDGGTFTPGQYHFERIGARIRDNYNHGSKIALRLQFNATWSGGVVKYDEVDWKDVGFKIAERFQDTVSIYGLQKLPNWSEGAGIPADSIVWITDQFASGVKEYNSDYVVASPVLMFPLIEKYDRNGSLGQEMAARTDSILEGMGALVKEGKLNALNLQYKNNLADYTSYDSSLLYRPVNAFKLAKEKMGLTEEDQVSFTSYSFLVGDTTDAMAGVNEAEENQRIMRTLWDAMILAGMDPHSYIYFEQFFHQGKPKWHTNMKWGGESDNAEPSLGTSATNYDITPNHRRFPMEVMLSLGEGVEFESTNATRGSVGLKGNGKTIWYFHNTEGWTDAHAETSLFLSGIPADVTELKVYTATSFAPSDVTATLNVSNILEDGYVEIATSELPTNQPILILAESDAATATTVDILTPTEFMTTNVREVVNNTFAIFPNPAADIVQVRLLQQYSAPLFIYTINGKLVKQLRVNQTENIDISDLEKGTYILRVNNNIERLVKQ